MTKAIIPRHIGYIMDGNRRWAKSHGLPAYEGHLAGYNAMKEVLTASFDAGITCVSVYAFSTENWQRQAEEVDKIMGLLVSAAKKDLPFLLDLKVRVRMVGRREGLSKKVTDAIDTIERETARGTAGILALCFNYGGQIEIVDAVKNIVQSGATPEEVTPEMIAEHLYEPDIPPCDIVVRTSGEQRLSGFMLWRAAYSEFLFVDTHWPDMKASIVHDIINEYSLRQRRFGG
ncbi:MAG TPA: polyprenyl diphosphate synthase [Candidatus Saccharibacteria bacterium]|nr:polyprenyl diphosphate synthase [Candidatus Saccharibacteria bacterium]